MFGKNEEKNGSITDAIAAGGDQNITISKIGVPVQLQVMGETINIRSVSAFVLDLIQQHIVDCIAKEAEKRSEISNFLKRGKKQIESRLQSLRDKENAEMNEENAGLVLEDFDDIESAAISIIQKQHEGIREQIMADLLNYTPIIQLLFFDNQNQNWVDRYDKWPPKTVLEKAISAKKIKKHLTWEEISQVMEVFWQKNDTSKVRGVFFRMAGLSETGLNVNSTG